MTCWLMTRRVLILDLSGLFEDIAECAAIARDFRPEPITARPSNAGSVSLTSEQMLAAHQNLQALMEARALLG